MMGLMTKQCFHKVWFYELLHHELLVYLSFHRHIQQSNYSFYMERRHLQIPRLPYNQYRTLETLYKAWKKMKFFEEIEYRALSHCVMEINHRSRLPLQEDSRSTLGSLLDHIFLVILLNWIPQCNYYPKILLSLVVLN